MNKKIKKKKFCRPGAVCEKGKPETTISKSM